MVPGKLMKEVLLRPYQLEAAAGSASETGANSIKIAIYDKSNILDLTPQSVAALCEIYRDSYCKSLWSTAAPELNEWYSGYEAKVWFGKAMKFYINQAKAGNSDIVISECKSNKQLLGALFVLKGDAFIENSDSNVRAAFIEKLNKAGAKSDKTLYGAEMFTSLNAREFGGTRRAVLASMVNKYSDYAVTQSFTHDLIWTLDVQNNPMISIAEELGFNEIPGGKAEKGVDLGVRKNGKFGYVVAREGPAVYLCAQLKNRKRP
ncbi:Uncharacterised protein [uncultured archaeon]|nr:Uncharacterised protein [uncultured archaeon]